MTPQTLMGAIRRKQRSSATIYGISATQFTMLSFIHRCCMSTYSHRSVATVLKTKPIKERIKIQGWVKAIRRQKDQTFVDVSDGSSAKNLQVILESSKRPSNLGYHSSICASGLLSHSSHKGQEVELLAEDIKVIDDQNLENYPFKPRTKFPPDYVRQYPHLRARTNFGSLLRIRSQAKLAMHQYFFQEGFICVDTPLITSNDCEGAGEVFTVKVPNAKIISKDDDLEEHFFDRPVFLTVSGQLHLEAMASGLSKVYNFSPTFRAENSQSRRHLSEFWMVEAEEAFLKGLTGFESLMNRVESLVKFSIQYLLDTQEEDLLYYWKQNDFTEKRVQNTISLPFTRLPYSEAMNILTENSSVFQTKPIRGANLGKEHELFLAKHMGNVPVFVTDWPSDTKAFYMCSTEEDSSLVYGLDLLFPDVGEVVGGGLREHDFLTLRKRLERRGLLQSLDWYLQLRQFSGRAPSGGFGLGFERFLLFLLGIHNIKDTVPFPRWGKHCPC
ncbi:hypothetical protein SK128_023428 [Halocaridina rubra]|uniref:asparagine--tRNA ligase n=1 Tax=Halocaridina rubra TaxID=373956 RepID=A0AAN9A0F9_HALRR